MPRTKNSKKSTQHESHEEDGEGQNSPAGSVIEDSDMLAEAKEHASIASLDLILQELREFRRDNGAQLKEIREEINKTNKRVEEVEERIVDVETQIQANEEAVTEMLKLHIEMDAKLTDLEGRYRRENIRIYGGRGQKTTLHQWSYLWRVYYDRIWSWWTPRSCEWKKHIAR